MTRKPPARRTKPRPKSKARPRPKMKPEHMHIDGCACAAEGGDYTDDRELPAARGGVAAKKRRR